MNFIITKTNEFGHDRKNDAGCASKTGRFVFRSFFAMIALSITGIAGTVDVDLSRAPFPSVYGRIRGANAQGEKHVTYPSRALARDNSWGAVRFGTADQFLRSEAINFSAAKDWSLEMWVMYYDTKSTGIIIDAGFGYKTGFRIMPVVAGYVPEGWISLVCGDGTSSKGITAKNGTHGAWHHVVVTSLGGRPVMYVDGIRARAEREEHEPVKWFFNDKTVATIGSPRGTPDMKFDLLQFHDRVMSEDEIKARYESGKSDANHELEKNIAAIRFEIPKDTQGYFNVGKKIPVSVKVPSSISADAIRVNGKMHKCNEKISCVFRKPGVYEIEVALMNKGRVICSETFPIAVVPERKGDSLLAFSSIATRTPASYALGSRTSYEFVKWAAIEGKKGFYDWVALDRAMEWNFERGIKVRCYLDGRPAWAKDDESLKRREKLIEILKARYDLDEVGVNDPAKGEKSSIQFFGFQQRDPMKPEVRWIKEEKDSAEAEMAVVLKELEKGAKEVLMKCAPDIYQTSPNVTDGRPGWKGVAHGVFNSIVASGAKFERKSVKGFPPILAYVNKDGSHGLIILPGSNATVDLPCDGIGLFGEKIPKGKHDLNGKLVYLLSKKSTGAN